MSTNAIKVAAVVRERRRSGRPAEVSVALLPLLRRDKRSGLPALPIQEHAEELIEAPLAPGHLKGLWILLALGLGALTWVALIGAGMALFHAFV